MYKGTLKGSWKIELKDKLGAYHFEIQVYEGVFPKVYEKCIIMKNYAYIKKTVPKEI